MFITLEITNWQVENSGGCRRLEVMVSSIRDNTNKSCSKTLYMWWHLRDLHKQSCIAVAHKGVHVK